MLSAKACYKWRTLVFFALKRQPNEVVAGSTFAIHIYLPKPWECTQLNSVYSDAINRLVFGSFRFDDMFYCYPCTLVVTLKADMWRDFAVQIPVSASIFIWAHDHNCQHLAPSSFIMYVCSLSPLPLGPTHPRSWFPW